MQRFRYCGAPGWVALLAALAGCRGAASHTMGTPPAEGPIVSVSEVKRVSKPVVVTGTMIEKCPVAGCWFMLQDKSGVIKVDTKNAGFVVAEVPINTTVTVAGTPAASGEARIAATGIRY